ncbi:hypothetical protein PVK06_039563 [Gossypium arboreum]|uniref:Uncharacterized protein n=1 Tax=Gossypium arboreum TaxID=29729 RepID=A0ABR0N381_GOSAR|nr:hypothetical protein PVK06_039563 [Gossypium arboreum]
MQFFGQADNEEWEEEEENKDKEEEEEELTHNKDFDDMFRMEQPFIGGFKICTPGCTNLTNSTGASATTPDTS